MSTFNNKNYNSDISYKIKINRNFINEDNNEYNIYYKRVVICELCINKNVCKKCNNKRFIETKQIFNNIIIKQRIICNECNDNKKCVKCNNNEYIEEEKKIILNIKGNKIFELIDNKQTIILKENGNVLKDKITNLVIIFND
jgi:DnaJ-class molecular chaperone